MLVFVESPEAIEKTVALLSTAKDDENSQNTLSQSSDLILRNPQYGIDIASTLSKVPPQQQTFYANVLSQAKTGWTPNCGKNIFNGFLALLNIKEATALLALLTWPVKMLLKMCLKIA